MYAVHLKCPVPSGRFEEGNRGDHLRIFICLTKMFVLFIIFLNKKKKKKSFGGK